MKTNKKLIIMVVAIALLLLLSPIANANYQITPAGARAAGTFSNMIKGIRNMEAEGQVMGLSETHSDTTLESTSGSNNIDVHMLKNTEYGAILLLSASPQYGKQGTGADSYINKNTSTGIATTTGNQYGVYDFDSSYYNNTNSTYGRYINQMYVAAGGKDTYTDYLNKYYDRYDKNENKIGDAMGETEKWKGNTSQTYYISNTANYSYIRTSGSNPFYTYYQETYYDNYNDSWYYKLARVGVWCGTGF